MNLSRGERFKDARIIHNKNGKQTQAEVYAATGIPASCIKDLEDDDVQRNVGYETIAKLASHYGVTSDFLLGLTEDPHIVPRITEQLGISSKAIDKIIEMNTCFPGAISDIITAPSFFGMLASLNRLKSDIQDMKLAFQKGWKQNLDFDKQIRTLEFEIENVFGFHASVVHPRHAVLYELNNFTVIAEALAKEASGYDELNTAEKLDASFSASVEELRLYFDGICNQEASHGEHSED